jgi:hypothetical protein
MPPVLVLELLVRAEAGAEEQQEEHQFNMEKQAEQITEAMLEAAVLEY